MLLPTLVGWAITLVATDTNARTTRAAIADGLPMALRVAFARGFAMGFTVVVLGIFGLSILYFLMTFGFEEGTDDPSISIQAL